tara:strand:- start:429 stop:815 length:387 start_codon:yes stop_codon:yes gene_type:complete
MMRIIERTDKQTVRLNERKKMLNLTPHAITIALPTGESVTFPPSGRLARLTFKEFGSEVVVGTLHGVPVIQRQFGAVEGLPKDGMPCLVSALVLSACPGREGVYAPDTGPTAIRKDGQVVAVTRLVSA